MFFIRPKWQRTLRGLELTYVHNGVTYTIISYALPRPRQWIAVYDAAGQNVTDEVAQYAGPLRNFHGIPVTPSRLMRRNTALFFHYKDRDVLHVAYDQSVPI